MSILFCRHLRGKPEKKTFLSSLLAVFKISSPKAFLTPRATPFHALSLASLSHAHPQLFLLGLACGVGWGGTAATSAEGSTTEREMLKGHEDEADDEVVPLTEEGLHEAAGEVSVDLWKCFDSLLSVSPTPFLVV